MPIKGKFKYDAEMIDTIYQQIKTCDDAGEPMGYEIRVDGQRVVPRTTKAAMFYTFDHFVKPNTKSVEIIFYSGESNFNERYIFWFEGTGGVSELSEHSLSGFEPEIKIRERVKKEYELENLRKEIEELQEEIEELEDDLEEAEEEKAELKNKLEEERAKSMDMWNTLFKELGGGLLGAALKQKIGIPTGAGLSGDGEENNSETKVNIIKEDAMDEESKKAIAFDGYLKERFQGKAHQKLMFIIDRLANDTSKIDQVLELLDKKGGKDE